MQLFSGLGVAVITPFDQNLNIDFPALEKVLEHLYQSNSLDYIVALGSTGEATALSDVEKQQLLDFIKDYNKGRLPLMVGHSGNNTAGLLELLKKMDYSGYSGMLSASPAYVRPTQEGIYGHYLSLAEHSPIPVMLYNVPSRTGSNIMASTVARLAQHKNIIGIKDASADLVQAMEIKNRTDTDFLLVSGDDMFTVPLCSVGTNGLISVLSNAYPKIFKDTLNACFTGDYTEAARLGRSILEINALMYQEGNPVGIKQLMAHLGLCEPYVRLPLAKASEGLSGAIKAAML